MRVEQPRSRRECLRLALLCGLGVLTTGCAVTSTLAYGLHLDEVKLPDLVESGLPEGPLAELGGPPIPEPTPALRLTPVPTSAPTQPPSQAQVAETPAAGPDTTLLVAKTDGDGVYLRRSITPEKKVRVWPDGTSMVVVGADQTVNGRLWKNVRDPAGNVGWVPAQYLVQNPPVGAAPMAPAVVSPTTPSGTTSAAEPARWNVADPDAFTNGNVQLAASQLRALGAVEVKGRAQRVEPSILLRDLTRQYGTIVRIEGYVGLIQQAPADSPIAKLLGVGVVQLVLSCRDGTVVDVFQLGPTADARIGDLVAAYGLPVGTSQVESRLAGPTSRLVVVGRLIEKLSK